MKIEETKSEFFLPTKLIDVSINARCKTIAYDELLEGNLGPWKCITPQPAYRELSKEYEEEIKEALAIDHSLPPIGK